MNYFVYLLITKSSDKLISYVGYTNNLKERLKKHNSSKGAKFTRGRYWKLAYSKIYSSKSKAMKEEYSLKNNIILRNKIKSNFLNEDFSTSSV